MKQEKDHIKDIFSSKLKDFEADLPPSLWNKIEADLPVQLPEQMVVRKPVYRIFSWVAAAAAVILAILYLVPQDEKDIQVARLIKDKEIKKGHSFADLRQVEKGSELDRLSLDKVLAEQVRKQSTPGLLVSSVTMKQTLAKARLNSSMEFISQDRPVEKTPSLKEEKVTMQENNENIYIADASEQKENQVRDPEFERELKEKIAAFEAAGENAKELLADNDVPKPEKENIAKGFSVGVEGGGGLSKSKDIANTFRYANASFAPEGLYTLRSQQYKLEHNQPISFGIAVNKKITDKISLESGVVYTYVSAKIRLEGNSEYNQNDRQYFHYLGIPLLINYRFAKWGKAEFYTSLGGMIQKDFYGRITSESSIDDLLNSERQSKRNISQSRPQFSATALLGAAYPLYNKLSIYTSLGGSYYFEVNNDYETIFSDRKWLFNLNFGFKFGF